MTLKLDDSIWWNGNFEAFKLVEKPLSTATNSIASLSLADDLRCTTCDVSVGKDRFSLVLHYHSEWHKYNLRRRLHKRAVVVEEEFEEILAENAKLSDLSSSDFEEDEASATFSSGVYEYFIHEGIVYSIYKSILFEKERPSSSFFARPLNCAIILLAGGHFSGGVFKDEQLVVHKTFHRYTVRAKQGGAQSVSDAKSGKAQSAGATLRRYNEKALKEEIQEVLRSWSSIIDNTPLIFIRSATYNRSLFVSDSLQDSPFLKSDSRLRNIPFETRRPTLEELMRIWQRLRLVRRHGEVDAFRKEIMDQKNLGKKKLSLQRTRQERKKDSFLDNSSNEDEVNLFTVPSEKQVLQDNTVASLNSDHLISKENIDNDRLTEEEKQKTYLAVRTNALEKLDEIMNCNAQKRENLINYLKFAQLPPDASSFLHLAAKRDSRVILDTLLRYGCDPSFKDASGLVPYEVADNRTIKKVFSTFRMNNPSAWDWKLTKIPELKTVSEEKLQKEAERKKQQKERRKLREKAKKEEERIEKQLKAERDAFLALSDREKRALAAERRLAAATQKLPEVVSESRNRCFQCGKILPAKPFEYSNNWFCQVPCVIEHRHANKSSPPQ